MEGNNQVNTAAEYQTSAENAEIIKPAKKKKTGLIITLIVIAVLAIGGTVVGAYAIFGTGNVRKIDDLYKVMNRTTAQYVKEMNQLKKDNAVFAQFTQLAKGITQQEISIMDEVDITVVNSAKDKRLDIGVSVPLFMDETTEFYFNDEEILLGFDKSGYLASTTKKIKDDFISLLEDAGMSSSTTEQLRVIFANTEFSYDGLTGGSKEQKKVRQEMALRYSDVMKKLLEAGEFSVEDDSVSYKHDGTRIDRKVQNVSIKLDQDIIVDWLEDVLIPTLEKDDDFEEMVLGAISGYENIDSYSYFYGYDYDDFIDEIVYIAEEMAEEELKVEISFVIYKGTIIKWELFAEDDYSDAKVTVEIKGEKNRLDDLAFNVEVDGEDETSLEIKGNHISGKMFESEIIYHRAYGYSDYFETVEFEIVWDTGKKSDNFTVTGKDTWGDEIDFVMTAAVDKGEIIFEVDDYTLGLEIEYRMKKIDKISALPTDTTPLEDVDIYDLVDMYGAVFSYGYY